MDGDGPPLICSVGPDGRFTSETPEYEGRWVKRRTRISRCTCSEAGLLLMREQYLHEIPFCWRAEEDPLIQYPRKSWFIRTTQFKDRMLANNGRINWSARTHSRRPVRQLSGNECRLGASRERYWGTPLPIWACDKTGQMEAVASYKELQAKPGARGFDVWEQAKRAKASLPDDLRVHKPYIDAITYDSPFARGGADNVFPKSSTAGTTREPCRSPSGDTRTRIGSGLRSSFPPISSAKHSIRRAAGSTACWRSARCCLATTSPSARKHTNTRFRIPIGRASYSA